MKKRIITIFIIICILLCNVTAFATSDNPWVQALIDYGVPALTQTICSEISTGGITNPDSAVLALITTTTFSQEFNPEQLCDGSDLHASDDPNHDNDVPHLGDADPIYSSTQTGMVDFYGMLVSLGYDSFYITVTEVDNPELAGLSDTGLLLGSSAGDVHEIPGSETDIKINIVIENGEVRLMPDGNIAALVGKEGLFQVKGLMVNGTRLSIIDDPILAVLFSKFFVTGGDDETTEDYGKAVYTPSSSLTPFVDMTPKAGASIWNTEDKYDVTKAIPTSENTSSSCSAKSVLYNIVARTRSYTGSVSSPVPITATVTYSWKYKNPNYNADVSGSQEYLTDSDTYTSDTAYFSDSVTQTYYDVPTSNIYPLSGGSASAKLGSYAVGSVSLPPSGINGAPPQTNNVTENKQRIEDSYSLTGSVGPYSSKSDAEAAAKDKASELIDAQKGALHGILDYTSCPSKISYSWQGLSVNEGGISGSPSPSPYMTGGSAGPSLIPSTYPNGTYVGQGKASYAGFGSVGMAPNNVVVHTPVVDNLTKDDITTEDFVNQKINIDNNIKYIQLDKKFIVKIPDNGVHIGEKGYSEGGAENTYNTKGGYAGTRKDTNWGVIKDYRFSFDVYVLYDYVSDTNYKTYLLKAETWLSQCSDRPSSIDLTKNSQMFLVPVWTVEGKQQVRTRVIAENFQGDYTAIQDGANKDNTKYIATRDVDVEVIGRIYDLQVINDTDVDWTGIQSSKYRKNYVLANEFPFGNIYRDSTTLSQNTNAAYQYAPKLGYAFTFSFKTKGRKSNQINIDVTKFQFASKTTGLVQDVDLYYKPKNSSQYVLLTNYSGNIKLTPNSPSLKVPADEITSSTKIYPIERNVDVYNKWIPSDVPHNYSVPVNIGTFKNMTLNHVLRFTYDNFAEYISTGLYKKNVDEIKADAKIEGVEEGEDVVVGSVGHWYAQYVLPVSTVAVPKGSNPNTQPQTILKNGYILVSFDIKTQEKITGTSDYLKYFGPEARFKPEEITGSTPKPGDEKTPEVIEREWNDGGTISTHIGTIPNEVTIPSNVVAMFESDFTALNDNIPGLSY